MDLQKTTGEIAADKRIPSRSHLLLSVVLLPAFVAGTNQLLFYLAPDWLFPGMVFTVAVLSWCSGRYLHPVWLRWAVFAWCLALLNLLTLAACLASGALVYHFAYVLVSAQISLLAIWTILSPVAWQWRLPGALIGAPALILFATSFGGPHYQTADGWNAMMVMIAVVVVLLCGSLRLFGFILQKPELVQSDASDLGTPQAHQFALKHLFIWATAMVPLLLVARGLDLILLARLDTPVVFIAALAAVTTATVNMIAIWAVLGPGWWLARLVMFLSATVLMAIGLTKYFNYVYSQYRSFSPTQYALLRTRDDCFVWLSLDAVLLAALLLFLRASGYRLARRSDAKDQ